MDLEAVIFDYGEVLTGPPDPDRHRNLLAIAAVEEQAFEKAYWSHRLDYDADILNGQTYWQTVARDTGVHFTAKQISELLEQDALMWMNLNPAMMAWIPRIKAAGFRLGILSNMGDGVLDYMRPRFSWLAQFDHLTWSCELGVVKPDPAIYLHTVKKLNVSPERALFIDNLEKNIVGAEAVGLRAALFQNVEQLQSDLTRRKFPLPALEAVS
ncbi:MAG: HAD family phosphatase [Acidobacteriaceae bacterium]